MRICSGKSAKQTYSAVIFNYACHSQCVISTSSSDLSVSSSASASTSLKKPASTNENPSLKQTTILGLIWRSLVVFLVHFYTVTNVWIMFVLAGRGGWCQQSNNTGSRWRCDGSVCDLVLVGVTSDFFMIIAVLALTHNCSSHLSLNNALSHWYIFCTSSFQIINRWICNVQLM